LTFIDITNHLSEMSRLHVISKDGPKPPAKETERGERSAEMSVLLDHTWLYGISMSIYIT